MTTSHRWRWFAVIILAIGLIANTPDAAPAQDKLDRTNLPIQPRPSKAITELDADRKSVV